MKVISQKKKKKIVVKVRSKVVKFFVRVCMGWVGSG